MDDWFQNSHNFLKYSFINFKELIYYLLVVMKIIKGQPSYPGKPNYPQQPHTPSTLSLPKKYKTEEKTTNLSNILQFEHDQYPFLNKYPISPRIYKTQLILNQATPQIKDRLSKIKHPNIICAREASQREKISAQGKKLCFLDIIYQEVPFSIKFIGFAQQNSSFLFNKIKQTNLRDVLNKITIYLMKMEINRVIRLTDIGVTQQGTIKVYLPPILPKGIGSIPQHMVFSNNYKLVSWWETTFSKQVKQPRYSPSNSPKNRQMIEASKIKLSYNHLQMEQRQHNNFLPNKQLGESYNQLAQRKESQEDLRIYGNKRHESKRESVEKGYEGEVKPNPHLKNSTKSYQCQLSKMATLQVQKMKKIDKQIKLIKQKLEKRQKQKMDKVKESQQFIQKNLQLIQKTLPAVKLVESQRRQANNASQSLIKGPEQVVFRDSIQQNINCINIYHTPTPNPHEMFAKKMPYQRSPYFPDPLDGISDQDSLDTYDIQFGNEEPLNNFQQPKITSVGKYDRQISERNYKVKKEELKQSQSKKNNHKNQVQNRKFQTESAGPLQFKNFVNNFIKPQFLAKKSNIYQDPMEEDSQHEFPQKVHYNELAQAGRSVASKTHQSHSTKKEKQSSFKKKDTKVYENMQEIHRVRSDNNLGILFTNGRKEEKQTINEQSSDQKHLINRVQDILLKTKRAIAVLNRMKQGNGGLMRKALSP